MKDDDIVPPDAFHRMLAVIAQATSVAMVVSGRPKEDPKSIFPGPAKFFDGEPTLRDCRKFVGATLKVAIEIIENPK